MAGLPSCHEKLTGQISTFKELSKFILNDDIFKKSNAVLEIKVHELQDKGMGHYPNKALVITRCEEEIL